MYRPIHPDEGMPIYVVMGTVGEYSARSEWAIAAYTDKSLAEKHVTLASARGREIESKRPENRRVFMQELTREELREESKQWKAFCATWKTNQYDPKFTSDFSDAATYFIYETELRKTVPGMEE